MSNFTLILANVTTVLPVDKFIDYFPNCAIVALLNSGVRIINISDLEISPEIIDYIKQIICDISLTRPKAELLTPLRVLNKKLNMEPLDFLSQTLFWNLTPEVTNLNQLLIPTYLHQSLTHVELNNFVKWWITKVPYGQYTEDLYELLNTMKLRTDQDMVKLILDRGDIRGST